MRRGNGTKHHRQCHGWRLAMDQLGVGLLAFNGATESGMSGRELTTESSSTV